MRLPALLLGLLLIPSLASGQAASGQAAPPPEVSPQDLQRAAVRDILQLQGAFATMQAWFLEARAGFEATKPGIPEGLLDNFWQESLGSFGLQARELGVLDACAAALNPADAQASLAFLRSPDMTIARQLMVGASDGVQTTASAFMREVAQNCCEASPTDFLMISRLKAPGVKLTDEQRARLDIVFAFLDVGPRAKLETMLRDEARARYPEGTNAFWEQENMQRAVAAHAEDMERAMNSVFVGHDEKLVKALASPEALAHREHWLRLKATLDAQGDAFVAALVNHSRELAITRGPALSGR